jgi:acetyl esterase/lipase
LRAHLEPLEGRALLSAGAFDAHRARDFPGTPPIAVQTLQAAGPRASAVPVMSNVVYRVDGGQPETLDVYEPAGPAPSGGWPVAMAIHGGGWHRFDKDSYGREIAPLTQYGYVVVAMNYQLSAPGFPSWPTNFEDVRSAVQWVRQNAAELHVDPNRVGAIGESAGGHLAALLAVYPDGPVNPEGLPVAGQSGSSGGVSARVQAVVDISGPTDLANLEATRPKDAGYWVGQFLGTLPWQDPGRYTAASPVSLVSSADPPMLIFHGASDPFVPSSQSRELSAALTAAGVPNRLILVPNTGHDPRGLFLGSHNLLPSILPFLDANLKHA